jgi:general secretion pathway protein D
MIALLFLCATTEAKIIKKRTQQDAIENWLTSTKVSFVANQTPVTEAVRLLPCNVRFDDITSDLQKSLVTAKLYDVPLKDVLDGIARQVGFGYEVPSIGMVSMYQYKDLSYVLPVTPLQESYTTSVGSSSSSDSVSASSNGTTGTDSAGESVTIPTEGTTAGSTTAGSSMNLSHSSKVDLWGTLKSNLERLIGESGRVTTDPRASMVYVRCPASAVSSVEEYMRKLMDALLLSVQVELSLVEVTHNDNREVGLDWNLVLDQMNFDRSISITAAGASSFILDPTGAPFTFNLSRPHGDSLQTAVLKTLRNYANIHIVERTTLHLRNNTATTLRRGTNVPYIDSITTTVTDSTSQTSVEKGSVLSGVDIGVMANVYQDLISLSLTPKVSQLLSIERVDVGDMVVQNPQTRIRENLVQVLLRNGQTAMIVGASNERMGYEGHGVPGLSTLPVLGPFFGTKAKYNEGGYIVLLVTPRVVRPDFNS